MLHYSFTLQVRVKPGESALAFYTAENKSSTPITGVSTYNVTPMKVLTADEFSIIFLDKSCPQTLHRSIYNNNLRCLKVYTTKNHLLKTPSFG